MFDPLIFSQNQNLLFSNVRHDRWVNFLVLNHDTQSSMNVDTRVLTQFRLRKNLLKYEKLANQLKLKAETNGEK